MKFIIFLAGIALAGYAGYQVEPSLRRTLTSTSHTSPTSPPVEEAAPTPVIDFASIPAEQLPAEVTLLSDVGFSDEATGIRMTLKAGANAKLVRLVDDIIIIRIGNTEYVTSVPISNTDLARRIGNPTPADPAVAPSEPPATPPVIPTEATPPAPDPATAPDPSFPGSSPTPEPTPAPALQPEPEPTPAPASTPATASQPTSAASIVDIMRQSLTNKEIKEFTAEQVKSWKAEPQETLEGATYDVGTVTYEQETIFGLKSIIAKAYISSGKVQRWIWPKSGLTIQ